MIGDTYWANCTPGAFLDVFFVKGSFRCMFYVFFPGKIRSLMVWNRRAPLETSLKISGSTDSTRSGRSCPDRHMVARCSRSTTLMWQVAGGATETFAERKFCRIFRDVDHRIWYLISLLLIVVIQNCSNYLKKCSCQFSLSWRSFGLFLFWLYMIIWHHFTHLRYFCSWQIPWEEYLQMFRQPTWIRTENWSDGDGKGNGICIYDISLASSGCRSQHRQ